MSMDHKAYPLEYAAFEHELAPVLLRALNSGSTTELEDFVRVNLADLKDPDEGTPPGDDWHVLVQSGPGIDPVQRWADLALTKYYDPNDLHGLTTLWDQAEEKLNAAGVAGDAVVLGRSLQSGGRYFDPALQGAYFQSPDDVRRNLEVLQRPEFQGDALLERWRAVLGSAAAAGKGLSTSPSERGCRQ